MLLDGSFAAIRPLFAEQRPHTLFFSAATPSPFVNGTCHLQTAPRLHLAEHLGPDLYARSGVRQLPASPLLPPASSLPCPPRAPHTPIAGPGARAAPRVGDGTERADANGSE